MRSVVYLFDNMTAARSRWLKGVGGRDLWPRLFTAAEQERLQAQADPRLAATIFFTAKEACYKAWALKGPLVFREMEIALDRDGFVAVRPDARLPGHYAVSKGVVLAAAWRKV